MARRPKVWKLPRLSTLNQENIVLAIVVGIFLFFSVFLTNFLTVGNLLSLVQNVSILGILGIAMAQVIIGRGIDLSLVATMVMSVAWSLELVNGGMPVATALFLGLSMALGIGLLNGFLVAYAEIPAIFATLAVGLTAYGFVHAHLLNKDVIYVTDQAGAIRQVGSGSLYGIPGPVITFAIVCLLAHLFLRFTRAGRYIYLMGDNPLAARITGVPTRPLIVLQYLLSSLVGFVGGVVTATAVNSMNTRMGMSTFVYDVILVVVIGGVGLSGGRGRILNVIIGTLLIGLLLNGMTLLDVPYTAQNIVKGVVLLVAIIVDSIVNPRDEQTSQQGDI